VDRFDLHHDIQCDSRVVTYAFYQVPEGQDVTLEPGERPRARLIIRAVGPLSAETLLRIATPDNFRDQSFHTYRWAHEAVDLKGTMSLIAC
jgi:cation diffusion facilitator CzcD-associated flavoprotein CzcO